MERQEEDGHDRCPDLSQSTQLLHKVSGLESPLPSFQLWMSLQLLRQFPVTQKRNVLRTPVHLLFSRQAWWEQTPPSKRGKARAGFGYRQGGQRCSLRVTGKYLFLERQMAIQTIKRPVFTIQQIAKEMVRRANQRKVLFNFPSVSSLNSVDLHQLRRQHKAESNRGAGSTATVPRAGGLLISNAKDPHPVTEEHLG